MRKLLIIGLALCCGVVFTATASAEVPDGTSACTYAFSDEFDGTGAYNVTKWPFRWGGSATPPAVPTLDGGSLQMQQGSYSIDLDRTGPLNYIGRPIPAGDWTVVAKVTNLGMGNDAGGMTPFYSQVGLKLYQDDNSWIKMTHTRAAAVADPANNTYFEMPYETNGTRNTGPRHGQMEDPGTVWLKVSLASGILSGAYATADPFVGEPMWNDIGHTLDLASTLPSGGPIYIGPYAGNGSLTAQWDYIRLIGETPTCTDVTPPTISHLLDPFSGPYVTPTTVTLTLDAFDADSGIASIEYNTGDGWQPWNELAEPTFSAVGTYSIDYRATDNDGNVSAVGNVSFEITDPVPVVPGEFKVTGKKKVTIKGKKAGKVKLTFANIGGEPITEAKVCAKAPKKKIKTKKCVSLGTIEAGATASKTLSFKTAKKFLGRKGSVKVKLTVTGKSGGQPLRAGYDVKANVKV